MKVSEVKQFWNWRKDTDIKKCWPEMERCLEKLPIDRDYYGFIRSVIAAKFGGIIRPITDTQPIKMFFDYFLNGYEKENHIDDYWLKNLDTFINYCRMLIFTVMQDELANKPDNKARFKKMILDKHNCLKLI